MRGVNWLLCCDVAVFGVIIWVFVRQKDSWFALLTCWIFKCFLWIILPWQLSFYCDYRCAMSKCALRTVVVPFLCYISLDMSRYWPCTQFRVASLFLFSFLLCDRAFLLWIFCVILKCEHYFWYIFLGWLFNGSALLCVIWDRRMIL